MPSVVHFKAGRGVGMIVQQILRPCHLLPFSFPFGMARYEANEILFSKNCLLIEIK